MSKRSLLSRWIETVREHEDLPTSAKAVLLILASYAAPDGSRCFPSQKRLAKNSGLTERSVRKQLKLAEKLGLLSISKVPKAGGPNSNLYGLRIPKSKPEIYDTQTGTGLPVQTGTGLPPNKLKKQEQEQAHVQRPPRRLGERARKQPSRAAKELLVLWSSMLGGHKLNPAVLEGATYEEMSTAMAWTLWSHRTSRAKGKGLRNLPGYYAAVLGSCRRGEKRLRAYCRQDMWTIVTQDVTPATFFT